MPQNNIISLWGRPHVIDYTTGSIVPVGFSTINKVSSVIFDGQLVCELRPNDPRLNRQWMCTLSQPILPLSKGYEVTVKSDFRYFVSSENSIRCSFSIGGNLLKQNNYKRDAVSGEYLTELFYNIKPNQHEFNLRIDISMRRLSTANHIFFALDTIDSIIL